MNVDADRPPSFRDELPVTGPTGFPVDLLTGLALVAPLTGLLILFSAATPDVFAWSFSSSTGAAVAAAGFAAATVLLVRAENDGVSAIRLAHVVLLASSAALAAGTLLHTDVLTGSEQGEPTTFGDLVVPAWVVAMVVLPLISLAALGALRRSPVAAPRPSGLVAALGIAPGAAIVAVGGYLFADPEGAARWLPFAAHPLDVRTIAAIQLGIGVGLLYAVLRIAPRELGSSLAGLATYLVAVGAALAWWRDDIDWTSSAALALGAYLLLLAGVLAGGVVLLVTDRTFPDIFVLPEVEPAEDYGFFGPDSVTWKVWSYPTSLSIGFQRSVVIEELDPALVAAVTTTHGIYDRPRTRYDRTLRYFAMVMFGDTRSTTRAADVLVKIHSKGIGVDPVTGERYDANAPASQLWILLTAWHSILLAYEVYGPGRLSAEEEAQYWAECARAAELQTCDPADVPRSREGIQQYFEEMRPQLVGSDLAKDAMKHLLRAEVMLPSMPLVLRPASAVVTWFLRRGTLATMPRWMRELVDLPTGRFLDAVLVPVLKVSFRVVAMSVRLELVLLRILSPMTLPLGARVLLGVPPENRLTMSPREAQARYGYDEPARAHADFRERQHARVFDDGELPRDDGLIESQPILGSIE